MRVKRLHRRKGVIGNLAIWEKPGTGNADARLVQSALVHGMLWDGEACPYE